MRILMILVPDPVGHADGPPVLQYERFLEPYYMFIDAGAEVVLASLCGGDPGMRTARGQRMDSTPIMRRFQDDAAAREALTDTLDLGKVEPADFDGAFCLGVSGGVWPPHVCNPGGAIIGKLFAAGRPVVAVPARLNLDPDGAGDGILITGQETVAATLAARALLGTLSGDGRTAKN